MTNAITLSWESSTREVGMEGFLIPFTCRKGMNGCLGVAKTTIRGYMEVLLGEGFSGRIMVRRLTPTVCRGVQSLLIHPVRNEFGGMDLYVEPSSRTPNPDEFLNNNGILPNLLDGVERASHI